MANGRDLVPRKHAETDSAQQKSEAPARESGARPAARFYEPLPLGTEAFVTPLAPADAEPPRSALRVLALILGSAALLGGSALGVALWIKSAPLRHSGPEPGTAHTEAMAEAAPNQPGQLFPEPEANSAGEAPAQPAPSATPRASAATRVASPAAEPVAPVAVATASAPVPTAEARVAAADSRTKNEPGSSAASSRAATPKSSHSASGAASSKLPEHPDRAQVIAAMQAVQPAVKACIGVSGDTATANLKIQGRTGRVTGVQVNGMPGAVGSCLARAVRNAHFPKFSADTLTISYPLHR